MSGTLSNVGANFSFNTAQAKGAADPTDAQDLVTLNYADTHYAGTGDVNVATDPIWNAKGDLAVGTASDLATRLAVGTADGMVLTVGTAQPTGIYWATPSAGVIGMPELIFRYTVTGSVKASIDTGSDTPDAGSNDWTSGDLLEVYLYARTDEAVATSVITTTLNNDTSGIYDRQHLTGNNTTASANRAASETGWPLSAAGTSHAAGSFSLVKFEMANYAGTVGHKTAACTENVPDTTAGNNVIRVYALQYRSTSAVTRLKVIPATAAKNFAVGTQLLIYKRRSA